MGSTTYDWSPLFSALQSTIGQLAQKKQYGDLLNTLGGGTPQPGLLSQLFNPTPVQQPSGPMAPAQMQDMQIPGGSPAAMNGIASTQPGSGVGAPPGGMPSAGGMFGGNTDLLRKLPPQIGMPLLLQMVQKQFEPDPGQVVHQGDSLVSRSGKVLYQAPAAVDYGEKGTGINPTTGKLDTYESDKHGGPVKWLGITPEPKAPTTRTVEKGDQTVTQEFNPDTNSWKDIGSGPKFAPVQPSVDRDILLPLLRKQQNGTPLTADENSVLAELKPGNVSQLTPEAINDGALYFMQNGKMPLSMRDKASAAAVQNRVAELKPPGMSSEDWMRTVQNNAVALHGRTTAAGQIAKGQAGTQVNEDTVVGSINIMNDLLKKGVAGPTSITSVNDAAQWMKRQFNDENATKLKNAIGTISGEYARVMTGSTSGSPSSDSARAEAAQRLLLGYTKGTLQANADQMIQEMRQRSTAYGNALNQLTGGAYSGVSAGIPYQSPNAQPAPTAGGSPSVDDLVKMYGGGR